MNEEAHRNYLMLQEVLNQLGTLTKKVDALQQENAQLKLQMITMSPAYSEDQRRNAMSQLQEIQQREQYKAELERQFEEKHGHYL